MVGNGLAGASTLRVGKSDDLARVACRRIDCISKVGATSKISYEYNPGVFPFMEIYVEILGCGIPHSRYTVQNRVGMNVYGIKHDRVTLSIL